jgi:hypothetical protein
MDKRARFRLSFIERRGPEEIGGVIYGGLSNKSNSRRIFNGISIKAEAALDFVDKVKILGRAVRARGQMRGATSEKDVKAGLRTLVLSAVVYGASWRRDLDVELLPDALQEAGVINNDRSIREKHYWWRLDKGLPRIEFTVKISEREV